MGRRSGHSAAAARRASATVPDSASGRPNLDGSDGDTSMLDVADHSASEAATPSQPPSDIEPANEAEAEADGEGEDDNNETKQAEGDGEDEGQLDQDDTGGEIDEGEIDEEEDDLEEEDEAQVEEEDEEEQQEGDEEEEAEEEPEEDPEPEVGQEQETVSTATAAPAALAAPAPVRAPAPAARPIAQPAAPITIVTKKRLGRPPKTRPPDWDASQAGAAQPGSIDPNAISTPRRRGRGGWRGRGGRKGGPQLSKMEQIIDKDGTKVEIVDDECVIPDDPDGETKVDRLGNLQGGREYRCRTFTVLGRGERLYMLSTEPARCVGFRDSYLFFTKHLSLYKIIADEEEKRDMIEREIIPHSYKGRAIGIVTARSVFREFGARMIVGGRRIVDDYRVADARAEGAVEAELADPADQFAAGVPYNKNQYVAWHGASSVYHTAPGGVATAAPTVSAAVAATGRAADVKKRRVNVTDTNWMLEHARAASSFNSRLTAFRQQNLAGTYEIHTNTIQYPAHMQPTVAAFEPVLPEEEEAEATPAMPAVPPEVARNYLVADVVYDTHPAVSPTAFYDGPEDDLLAPFRGLTAVSDEIADLLPPDCRRAFDEARAREVEAKARWKARKEFEAQVRRAPVIDRAIVPMNAPPKDP